MKLQRLGVIALLVVTACGDNAPSSTPLADSDLDGDGFAFGDDCNEFDSGVNPGAEEVLYNGLDDDCDPSTPDADADGDGVDRLYDCDDDDPSIFRMAWVHLDSDGDGFVGTPLERCLGGETDDESAEAVDCDDTDERIFPGAATSEPELCTVDADGDGYGDRSAPGGAVAGSDCNDADAGFVATAIGYLDGDGDGFGGPVFVVVCGELGDDAELVESFDDCNDGDAQILPGGLESPDDGIDGDCDGTDISVLELELAGGVSFVDPDAIVCPGNGSSSAPYCQLTSALDNAGAGERIVLAKGVYAPFVVDEQLSIVGGYSGLDWTRSPSSSSLVTGEVIEVDGDSGRGAGIWVTSSGALHLDGVVIEQLTSATPRMVSGITTSGPLSLYRVDMAPLIASSASLSFRSVGVEVASDGGPLEVVDSDIDVEKAPQANLVDYTYGVLSSSSSAITVVGSTVVAPKGRNSVGIGVNNINAPLELRNSTVRSEGLAGLSNYSAGVAGAAVNIVDSEVLAGISAGSLNQVFAVEAIRSLSVSNSVLVAGASADSAALRVRSDHRFEVPVDVRESSLRVVGDGVAGQGIAVQTARRSPSDLALTLSIHRSELSITGSAGTSGYCAVRSGVGTVSLSELSVSVSVAATAPSNLAAVFVHGGDDFTLVDSTVVANVAADPLAVSLIDDSSATGTTVVEGNHFDVFGL